MRSSAHLQLAAFIIVAFNEASFSQICADCRYASPQFDSVTIETRVKFGSGPRYGGAMQDLYMDIYQPYGDTMSARPVAIFAFGGAFITGSRDDWYVILACTEIAKAGFVVAAIDYRIYDDVGGMIAEIIGGFPPQQMRIFFRPMQDMRAAVQYLKADFAELGNNYRIDTSKMLIGGASSGGITALMTAYCDKDSEMAAMGGGSLDALDASGGFYTSTGLYPAYSWKAAGVFNVSGAMIDADWIEPGDIPMISAHGDADQIVPYKKGGFLPGLEGFFDLQGSYVVDSVARTKGVCSYLYTMEGKDHPSDTLGIEYLKSVVYRMMLRMHAVVNGRSFCSPMELKINPVDTVYYQPGGDSVCLAACVDKGTANTQIKWCGINCLPSAASSPVITFQPDTNLRYVTCIAYESGCQSVSLSMVKQGSPVSCEMPLCAISAGPVCVTSTGPLLSKGVTTMKVYPHPVSGVFTVYAEFTNPAKQPMLIEILDIAGKKVFGRKVLADTHLDEMIDVHGLESGSYLLAVHSGEIRMYQKLMVIQ